MLILLYNLYSLLFLLKNDINDIIFIEYSNRIACSNRVKQRCVLQLQSELVHCYGAVQARYFLGDANIAHQERILLERG